MHYLDYALNSPRLTSGSRILNLFDHEGVNSRWLTNRGISHTHCSTEDDVRRIMNSGMDWDLVIATTGMQRFYATNSDVHLLDFVSWLKKHSKLGLVTPHHEIPDPSNRKLGPYRLNPNFTIFNYFSEIPTDAESETEEPAVALSDHVLFDGLNWHESANLRSLTRGLDGLTFVTDTARRPRTFMHTEGFVIKSQVGCPDYFDSMEVIREAEVLQNLSVSITSTLGLPRVLHVSQGRAVSTLVRQGIAGRSLNSRDKGLGKDSREQLMKQVIDLACTYAELGLFHNDFRPWNVLCTPNGLEMIDFADVSTLDQDVRDLPQILALVGTLIECGDLDTNGFNLRPGELFDTDLLDIVREYLGARGMTIGSLYDRPWLELPAIKNFIALGDVKTSFDLCDQVLTSTVDRSKR